MKKYESIQFYKLITKSKVSRNRQEKIAETQARLLETERKLHSRQAALDIVSELVPNAIDQLTTHGYLSDSQQLTSRTFRDEETNTQERLEDYTKNNGEITEEMNFEAGKAESTNEQEENPFDKTQDIIKGILATYN